MQVRTSASLKWLLAGLVALAAVAAGLPELALVRVAYALEKGKIQATGDELARVEEVSNAFRMVAKVARPGVVHIRLAGTRDDLEGARKGFERRFGEELSDEDWQDFLKRHTAGSGSGIVLDQQGHILTNNHVVRDQVRITVRTADGRELAARLVGADEKSDIAVLKVDAADLHPLKFGDSDKLEVGDWVLAVGAPFGLAQTVTHGIVSAVGRSDVLSPVEISATQLLYQNFIQTDAAINPGNSGGPLLNLRGEVVGVNTAIAHNGRGENAGVAFVIPGNMARRVADQLIRNGGVTRGWLGIHMRDPSPDDREFFKLPAGHGVLVHAVLDNTPAAAAGLLVEDAILSVNGVQVENMGQLRVLIADVPPGEKARLRIIRDGQEKTLEVPVAERPADSAMRDRTSLRNIGRLVEPLGVYARSLPPYEARNFDFERGQTGVLCLDTRENAAIRLAQKPELIIAVDGRKVETVAELQRVLRDAGSERTIDVKLMSPKGEIRTERVSLAR